MNTKVDRDRLVTTKFGKTVPRRDCRYIREEFYKVNEEVFKFYGKWYRINSGYLIQDVETGEWLLKADQNLIYGIAINKEGKIVLGHFKENVFNNICIDYHSLPEKFKKQSQAANPYEVYASNINVAHKLGLVEDISTGNFTSSSRASSKIAINNTYHFNVDYSFEHSGDGIKGFFKEYLKTLSPNVKHGFLLRDVSFGWEFETTDGFIHPRHLVKTGLIPLRDGSINGFEFATCPLRGSNGLHVLKEAARVLSKYTTKNTSCSLHLHIGNLPKTENYLMVLYNICRKIEGEMYSLFPTSIRTTSVYKDRDYCSALPPFGWEISRIIDWLAGIDGYYDAKYRGLGTQNHPADRENNRKWAINSRYYWVNFVPFVFGTRGTVEFRLHTATTNETKLINWLFICAGIVNFAKKFSGPSDLPTRISLFDIMESSYPSKSISTYLNKYIQLRKDSVKKAEQLGDFIGTIEMQKDLKFTFPFEGKNTLVDA